MRSDVFKRRLGFSFNVIQDNFDLKQFYTTVKNLSSRVKAHLNFKNDFIRCYAFPSNESLFT